MPGIPPSDCLFQEPPCLDRFVKPAVPCWRPTPRLQPSRRARPANSGLGGIAGDENPARSASPAFALDPLRPRLHFAPFGLRDQECSGADVSRAPVPLGSFRHCLTSFPFLRHGDTGAQSLFICRVSSVLLTSIFFAACDDCFIPPSNRSLAVAARILCFILASDF